MNEQIRIRGELNKAKALLKTLEAEYRKVCECNNRNTEMQFINPSANIHAKMYETCEYHKVRVTH